MDLFRAASLLYDKSTNASYSNEAELYELKNRVLDIWKRDPGDKKLLGSVMSMFIHSSPWKRHGKMPAEANPVSQIKHMFKLAARDDCIKTADIVEITKRRNNVFMAIRKDLYEYILLMLESGYYTVDYEKIVPVGMTNFTEYTFQRCELDLWNLFISEGWSYYGFNVVWGYKHGMIDVLTRWFHIDDLKIITSNKREFSLWIYGVSNGTDVSYYIFTVSLQDINTLKPNSYLSFTINQCKHLHPILNARRLSYAAELGLARESTGEFVGSVAAVSRWTVDMWMG